MGLCGIRARWVPYAKVRSRDHAVDGLVQLTAFAVSLGSCSEEPEYSEAQRVCIYQRYMDFRLSGKDDPPVSSSS
jgi:hypothetical protein